MAQAKEKKGEEGKKKKSDFRENRKIHVYIQHDLLLGVLPGFSTLYQNLGSQYISPI